ncbi:MAG TPA: extradiol ring-cleavage dioxygenase [Bacillota bacterium]
MAIVGACIAPHGEAILPELAGDAFEAFAQTRQAMEELSRRMAARRPEVIVLATPHGLRLEGHIAVVTSEYVQGSLTAPGGDGRVAQEFRTDREMARAIVQRARGNRLPAVGCNYGALEGQASNVPLDWGSIIPLHYLGARLPEAERPRLVLVGPTREIPLSQLVQVGRIVAELAEESDRRVLFVASADQGHAHQEGGPYGFSPAAANYDATVKDLVVQNRLHKLLDIDPRLVDEAKPDSLWQMLILHGVTQIVPMKAELLSYEVPTYFGMLVADYQPERGG